jgi:uncharacterized protein (DUF488 family)
MFSKNKRSYMKVVDRDKDLNYIFDLLKHGKRIALTCFEANVNQCHRKHLAEAISFLPEFNYELKHI